MQLFDFYIGFPNPLSPVLIPNPDNWQALELELSFENDSPQAVLNAKNLVWKGAQAAIMNQYLQGGLNLTTNGIFEGIPLTIYACNTSELVFNGIIDLTDTETKFTCDIVSCKITDYQIDLVKQLMNQISFGFLATSAADGGCGAGNPGYINPSPNSSSNPTGDYLVIPYQRNDIPDYEQLLMLCLSMYQVWTMGEDAEDCIEEMIATVLDIEFPPLNLIFIALQLIAYSLLLIFLLIVMYDLLKTALNCLVSPVLTKFGMYAQTLMQRACDYFGLGFQSTILINHPDYSKLVIMPTKSGWVSNKTFTQALGILGSASNLMEYDDLYNLNHGGNAYGYYDGTCADFIASMEQVFNAKAKIILNTLGQPILHFERWDYNYNLATYTLPNISDQTPFNSSVGPFNLLGGSKSAFSTNASELFANYSLKYNIDTSDVNTLNEYDGTSCYCTTSALQVTTGLRKNVTLRGLKEINFEFAQATRKDSETSFEKFFAGAYAVILTICDIATLGAFSSTFNPIPSSFNLVGHMVLSNNLTGAPKMFIAGPSQTYRPISLSNWNSYVFTGITVDPNNKQIMSAAKLMKRFHFSNLPLSAYPGTPYSTQPAGTIYYNQWIKYKNQTTNFCCADFNLVKSNNIITTFDGQQARVDTMKYNPFKGMANLDYRVNKQFTKNLQSCFVVDGVTKTSNINNL